MLVVVRLASPMRGAITDGATDFADDNNKPVAHNTGGPYDSVQRGDAGLELGDGLPRLVPRAYWYGGGSSLHQSGGGGSSVGRLPTALYGTHQTPAREARSGAQPGP